jgi:predicted CXXCH cytochrome family protein
MTNDEFRKKAYAGIMKVKRSTNQRHSILGGLFLGLLCVAFFLGPAIHAQETKPKKAPTIKPHEPLAGKACIECHKQAAYSGVRCLLAKRQFCVACHDIPAAGGVSRLVVSREPLCFQCHSREGFKGGFVHGPFAVGACLTCHDPHGGNAPGMLRAGGRQMCLSCHQDMNEQIGDARFKHKAMANGCTDCHAPHASEQRYQLKAAVPALCAKCHEKLVGDLQKAASKHSPTTEAPACMNCHDPHMSAKGRLLLDGGLSICLKCHDKPVKVGEYELANIKELLAQNPNHHGPIQSKDCAACHNPHSSPYFRLLTDDYPEEFYAPFFESNYALCFRCHESKLAKESQTTTGTGFRDGDRNLHFIHVDRSSHGRTCRSCHEIHASSLPKHIGATVPFGEWGLPVKFSKTESGGSCEPGCHTARKYDRLAAVKQK